MNGQVQLSHPVLVVGAGAAGISAALWLHDRKIPFQWMERSNVVGGTLLRVGNPIDELIGTDSANGPELVEKLQRQLAARGIAPSLNTKVEALGPAEDYVDVTFESGGVVSSRRFSGVIVTTGTHPRRLGLPLEEELWGRGIEISVTRRRHDYAGKAVAVVGGGDAALEGALLLAEVCSNVSLIHRRESFRAQTRFIEAVRANPRIHVSTGEVGTLLTSTLGNAIQLRGVQLTSGVQLDIEGLFVRLGVEPVFPAGTIRDETNRANILCDEYGRTSQPRVYVAGDLSATHFQSVSWCAGSSSRAVSTLCQDLGIVAQ